MQEKQVNLNPWIMALALSIVVCAAQVIISQSAEIASLHRELRLASQAQSLSISQAQELYYELTQATLAAETIGTRQYVAGVVDTVDKPDRYTEIWHSGYDRGCAVQSYADKLDNAQKTSVMTKE